MNCTATNARFNQFGGDGFMALAPVAHEDHARRAVLAALAIQRALPERRTQLGAGGAELAVRIGVNTGPVIVGAIGDNLRMDYTAVADTTNLAARLQQHAEPGGILISEATYHLVRDDFQTDQLDPIAVKGKSKPIVSYRVRAPSPRHSPLRGLGERALSEFVGRDPGLKYLLIGDPHVKKSDRAEFARIILWTKNLCTEHNALPYFLAINIMTLELRKLKS